MTRRSFFTRTSAALISASDASQGSTDLTAEVDVQERAVRVAVKKVGQVGKTTEALEMQVYAQAALSANGGSPLMAAHR